MTGWGCRAIAASGALAIGLLSTAPSAAEPAPPTPQDLAAIAMAEKTGNDMARYDAAAWRTTDLLAAELAKSGKSLATLQREQGAAGYVVEPADGDSLTATYYGVASGVARAIARYRVNGVDISGGLLTSGDTQLSPLAVRMIAARDKAIAQMTKPGHNLCTPSSPNSLILPAPDGSMAVYILSSTTDASSYPAGGHFRFTFDQSGNLTSERAFTKTCIEIRIRGAKNEKLELAGVTHLLDPQPTEIHTFISHQIPVPLIVVTPASKTSWLVVQGRITAFDADSVK